LCYNRRYQIAIQEKASMPIYEYRCHNCRRRVNLYIRFTAEDSQPACPQCESTNLSRLFSTFAIRKSDSSVYEGIFSDSHLVKGLENDDPRALAEWNRRMGSSMDEEVAPEYEEMLERLEGGEMPPREIPEEAAAEESD
jgi:putative FmdB family regulatory protein